jgi:hypothetical protein
MTEKIKLKVYRELSTCLRDTFDRCITRSIDLEDKYRRMGPVGANREDVEAWDFIRLVDLVGELLADNLRLREQEAKNGK